MRFGWRWPLRARIAEQLVRNRAIAKAVTEGFGGRFVGFFHPVQSLSKNTGAYIPASVRAFIKRRDVPFVAAQRETIAAIVAVAESWAQDFSQLHDKDPDAQVFLDAAHTTLLGAQLAAQAIVAALPSAAACMVGAPAPAAVTAAQAGAGDSAAFLNCPAKAVNDLGVGKPCDNNAQCVGQGALTCLADAEPGGFPFCTTCCFGLEANECGANARCIRRKDRPGVCAPDTCAAQLEHTPNTVLVDRRCTVGSVNDYGVGRSPM